MTVLPLKTELDVARLLLADGWLPEEINGILVFPLPRAAFDHLTPHNAPTDASDIIPATPVTLTALHQARQLFESAGWPDRELDSLLKPCLYSPEPWANHTWPNGKPGDAPLPLPQSDPLAPSALQQYRRRMALKRLISLGLVIIAVSLAVLLCP